MAILCSLICELLDQEIFECCKGHFFSHTIYQRPCLIVDNAGVDYSHFYQKMENFFPPLVLIPFLQTIVLDLLVCPVTAIHVVVVLIHTRWLENYFSSPLNPPRTPVPICCGRLLVSNAIKSTKMFPHCCGFCCQ